MDWEEKLLRKRNQGEVEEILKKVKTEYETVNKEVNDLHQKSAELRTELLKSQIAADASSGQGLAFSPQAAPAMVDRAIPFGYVNPTKKEDDSLETELRTYKRMLNEAVNEVLVLRRCVQDLTLQINARRTLGSQASYDSQCSQTDMEDQRDTAFKEPHFLDD